MRIWPVLLLWGLLGFQGADRLGEPATARKAAGDAAKSKATEKPAVKPGIVEAPADRGRDPKTPISAGTRPKSGAEREVVPSVELDHDTTLLTIIEEVEVPAKVDGVIAVVEVKEGQMVESHDVLARIEDTESKLALESATVEFDIAKKQAENDLKIRIGRKAHDVAKTELRRALDSNAIKKNAVSDAEIDRLRLAADKTELETAQAVIEQETAQLTARLKETAVKVARHAIDRREIVSPISGMVVQVNSHAGEWVEAGKTVVRVLRLDRLRVEFFVSANRLKDRLVGRKVTFQVDLPDQPGAEFGGEIVFVSPEVDHINQTIRVWAEIDNSKLQLNPGLRGKITIRDEKTAEAARRPEK
ncbi:MAG: efflux RND transporter periplasmic adaptor subunit [Planctomycetes bacterium]|nr:efflux RND transporter periplasmic adaptor subunit [Planctomycetota bacterium]